MLFNGDKVRVQVTLGDKQLGLCLLNLDSETTGDYVQTVLHLGHFYIKLVPKHVLSEEDVKLVLRISIASVEELLSDPFLI